MSALGGALRRDRVRVPARGARGANAEGAFVAHEPVAHEPVAHEPVAHEPVALLAGGSERGPAAALAAGLAVELALAGRPAVLFARAGAAERRPGPTPLASPAARELERRLRERGVAAAARGHLCRLAVADDPEALAELGRAALEAGSDALVIELAPGSWSSALAQPGLEPRGALLLAELPRERSLAALAVAEGADCGLRLKVSGQAPGPIAGWRYLAGMRAGGRLSARLRRWAGSLAGDAGRAGEAGQALPAVLGAALGLLACALALAAIGGALSGEARAQRAADLAALSAARSMRDDLPRLLSPPLLPDGSADPRHLTRADYLARARTAAAQAARRNGVDPARLRLAFPDREATPPLRARATVLGAIDPTTLPGGERLEGARARPIEVEATAVAEATPPGGSWTGMPAQASSGGYSGPLAYRTGEGMRPDVARAFDLMAAAARRAGVGLAVNSGFRSDAEQARLFAAHPDPRWVAPPGRSLHRCATELDLGPSGAYAWLAANARRFGFVQRYSWEPWHYGFAAGPPPCSAAGNWGGLGAGAGAGTRAGIDPDGAASASGLPSFVPARYRDPITRSAARWNVSGALLAAQLMAESGFDPNAGSSAGAQGIAQFMPATAATYGLRNPFDPEAAIDAQAHLMSDLLRQFGSVPLALAAYNAGPGAVQACSCSGPYAETRAYVARILALLAGAGASLAPALEVRLVR